MPKKEKAHLSGGPIPNFVLADKSDNAETAADRPAQKLRRLFSFCHATACAIASLAWGCAR
jgi:hypothetical protein